MPLGHPAHALHPGKTTVAAGLAGRMLVDSAITGSATAGSRLRELTVAPDVSPWVAGRVGLGSGFEGGLTATTRAIRIDARKAFESDNLALSVGLGAAALMAARPAGGGDATGVFGGGLDVPILLGWRSSADLYAIWLGPRVGAELFTGRLGTAAADGTAETEGADGSHLHVGGTLGMRAGFRRVFGIVEVEASYHHAEGRLGATSLTLAGVTITPAAALVVSF